VTAATKPPTPTPSRFMPVRSHDDPQPSNGWPPAVFMANQMWNEAIRAAEEAPRREHELTQVSIYRFAVDNESGAYTLLPVETRTLPKTLAPSGYLGHQRPLPDPRDWTVVDAIVSADREDPAWQYPEPHLREHFARFANATAGMTPRALHRLAGAFTLAMATRACVALDASELS
jgi:hypothetical protein